MMNGLVYINGEYFAAEDAKISIFDHGFLYGDGVFESIRSYNGNVFRLKEHIERLYESAKYINLKIPESQDKMLELVCETVKRTQLKDAYVRLVISRGVGDLYVRGIKVITTGVRRITNDAMDVRAKTLNYLEQYSGKDSGKHSSV
jgi:branched-chain amino acid aminotransferase